MKYTVKFFTRDIINGEFDDEHQVGGYSSDMPIPIPFVGTTVLVDEELYVVKDLSFCYPNDDEFEYETDVFVEVER